MGEPLHVSFEFFVMCNVYLVPSLIASCHFIVISVIRSISSNPQLVSPDTAIAIVFGLVGALISFIGLIIACLTLRFMMLDKCMFLSLLRVLSSSVPNLLF